MFLGANGAGTQWVDGSRPATSEAPAYLHRGARPGWSARELALAAACRDLKTRTLQHRR
jgi:hypothetical protein